MSKKLWAKSENTSIFFHSTHLGPLSKGVLDSLGLFAMKLASYTISSTFHMKTRRLVGCTKKPIRYWDSNPLYWASCLEFPHEDLWVWWWWLELLTTRDFPALCTTILMITKMWENYCLVLRSKVCRLQFALENSHEQSRLQTPQRIHRNSGVALRVKLWKEFIRVESIISMWHEDS